MVDSDPKKRKVNNMIMNWSSPRGKSINSPATTLEADMVKVNRRMNEHTLKITKGLAWWDGDQLRLKYEPASIVERNTDEQIVGMGDEDGGPVPF